jgi:uncharacterized membrane protein
MRNSEETRTSVAVAHGHNGTGLYPSGFKHGQIAFMTTPKKPAPAKATQKSGSPFRAFTSRPVLLSAVGFGLLAGAALVLIPNPFEGVTRSILAWDLACAWFVVGALAEMKGANTDAISQRAARQDEGGHAILGVVVLAAMASLGAVAFELSQAKGGEGLEKTIRVFLAFVTVAVSWFMVQLVFALHYAHQFYRAGPDKKPSAGLSFPGGEAPDYWDFLHFALIIGVANQTADIAFTCKSMRRTGTLHGVLAFLFNTIVLALTINLAASLF